MTFRPLLILLALAFALPSARAEVLIYAGTTQRTDARDNYVRKTYKVFFVSNPDTGETATFFYGKFDGQKHREGGTSQDGDYVGGTLAPGSKDTDVYAHVEQIDKMLGFQRYSTFLRGTRKDVQVNLIGGNPVFVRRARVLKGSILFLAGGIGPGYVEEQLTVTLDTTRTVDANVRNLNYAQAVNEIDDDLSARGYNR